METELDSTRSSVAKAHLSPDTSILLADESPEEAADAILSGLEYLAREAQAAGLQDLARALVGVISSPGHWPRHEAGPPR